MKKEEKTERTRERILKAAMQEFGTKGYASTTVNAICGNYHIPKGLLYHNFTGKDELYLACVSQCFSDLVSFLQTHAVNADIQTYMELRLQYFSQNPLCAHLFFEAVLQPFEALADQIKERKKSFDVFNKQMYRAILSKMTLRGGVRETDAMEYFELMLEIFNGYFRNAAHAGKELGGTIAAHEKKLAQTLDFMLYGTAERNHSL